MFNRIEAARELKSLMAMREELEAEITALQDGFKICMQADDCYEMKAGDFKVTWNTVQSSRLDTAAIKRECPDLAARYTKATVTRRFVLN